MPDYSPKAIKKDARELVLSAKPSPIVAALILISVLLVLDTLSTRLTGIAVSQNDMTKYMNLVQAGRDSEAIEFAASLYQAPSALNSLVDMLIRFLMVILSAGYSIFTLNTVRKTGTACYENLLDGFGLWWKIILMSLLESVIIFALSLLLIFPGIIIAYSYRQSLYILIDHPELSPIKCMKLSRQLMKGHKLELFKLDLSLLGWYILSTFMPCRVWTRPYTETVRFMYYEQLCSPSAEAV